jgi:hypothetical protein
MTRRPKNSATRIWTNDVTHMVQNGAWTEFIVRGAMHTKARQAIVPEN